VRQLAESGWRGAPQADPALRAGLNIAQGDVVHAAIADRYDLPLRLVTLLLEGTEAASTGRSSGSGASQCRQRLQTLVFSPLRVTW
jgi:hypothetical protein